MLATMSLSDIGVTVEWPAITIALNVIWIREAV